MAGLSHPDHGAHRVDRRHLRRALCSRLLDQHPHPLWHGACDRNRRRRRDRSRRKHRKENARVQPPGKRGGAPSHGRSDGARNRDRLRPLRGIHPRSIFRGDRRTALPPVCHHDRHFGRYLRPCRPFLKPRDRCPFCSHTKRAPVGPTYSMPASTKSPPSISTSRAKSSPPQL